MNREQMEADLKGIRQLLSLLHGEVATLETSYSQVLSVLRKLETKCEIDDLTGLMRRGSFFEKWKEMLAECARLNESAGLLLIDIDHFKLVNDTHGHPAGDEVLKRVADMLKKFESPHCVVGRYGGEEFIVAVRGTDAEALGTAEFIRRGAEHLTTELPNGVALRCTVSVGMASAQSVGYDAPRLLQSADEALYDAKKSGRNQVRAA